MPTPAYRALQLLLWYVCLSHLAIGLSLNVPLVPLPRIADMYGARVDWTPQFVYILKPLGAFMLVLGGLAGAAALRPLRQRAIVHGLVALFVVRALQRVLFQEEAHAAFGIAPGVNLGATAFFLALAAGLLLLHRHVAARAGAQP